MNRVGTRRQCHDRISQNLRMHDFVRRRYCETEVLTVSALAVYVAPGSGRGGRCGNHAGLKLCFRRQIACQGTVEFADSCSVRNTTVDAKNNSLRVMR